MTIDALLTPNNSEPEDIYEGALLVMIDVLRASTTICAALEAGAREVIPTAALERAVQIYGALSPERRFLGGERDGIKPSGFDAGNSPLEYTPDAVAGRTVILSTTNGAPLFLRYKFAAARIVGSFVNFDAVMAFLRERIESGADRVAFFCAGSNGRFSYEDALCAGAFIDELSIEYPDASFGDAAAAARNLFALHAPGLKSYLKTREHAQKLIRLGFEQDIDVALDFNRFPVTPFIEGASIKRAKNLAEIG
ncbi:MAG: 2-phosphosulfolactate phosphatase [Chloroflexota bacterium]